MVYIDGVSDSQLEWDLKCEVNRANGVKDLPSLPNGALIYDKALERIAISLDKLAELHKFLVEL